MFSAAQYLAIHRRLFAGIYPQAGKVRTYNISKKEWVLAGDTVTYGNAADLMETLEYDLAFERAFSYRELNATEIIEHLASLWLGCGRFTSLMRETPALPPCFSSSISAPWVSLSITPFSLNTLGIFETRWCAPTTKI